MEENIGLTGPDQVLKRPERKKKVSIPLILLILVLWLAVLFYVNDFQMEIQLTGEPEVLLEYGGSYRDPGARVVLRGKWFQFSPPNVDLQIKDQSVRPDALGTYTVEYGAEYLLWQAAARRTVRVVDTVRPLLILKSTGRTVLPGRIYEEEGYVAIDNHDGNLTDQVQRREKMGYIIYTVTDSSGNSVTLEREIPYHDPEPPELILEGGAFITIPCGTIFEEPGYTSRDNVNGDMTEDVAIEGEVIWYQPGTYQLVYTVADSFGNVTQKLRTVTVEGQSWPETIWPQGKVIYLTFDDGPAPDTIRLLNLLKAYGVRATFFVTGSGSSGELWRMHKEGHSIGIHTMTHDYEAIYSSEEAFFTDLYGMQDIIYRNTGVKTTLMRFPGGGSNLISNFNEGIMTRLARAVQDSGFQYFDWNVDSNDAGGALKRKTVADNVIAGIQKQQTSIVLQHDIHGFSVDAVEDIIIWGLENGYRFLPLTENSPTMHHTVLN